MYFAQRRIMHGQYYKSIQQSSLKIITLVQKTVIITSLITVLMSSYKVTTNLNYENTFKFSQKF